MAQTFSLGAVDAAPSAGQTPAANAQVTKMKDLAQQFEGLLLLQMMREMRQSMDSSDSGHAGGTLLSGAGTMTSTMDTAFALQMGKAGGFGLAQALMGSFVRQVSGEPVTGQGLTLSTAAAAMAVGVAPTALGIIPTAGVAVASPAGADTAAPAEVPEAGTGVPPASTSLWPDLPDLDDVLDAPVNSPFGWRKDPIDGQMRFHNGVDLRAAYGQEVPVVGAGTVAFAGEQGGYGLTVLVQHAGGLETRYAHLSSIGVQAGDDVQAGQVIGRVGQSGRATGPHLHFEITKDGRRLDPETAAQQLEP